MSNEISKALCAPFEEKDLKHRPGRAGMTFTYADARAVAQRLDDTLGIEGWQSASSQGGVALEGGLLVRKQASAFR